MKSFASKRQAAESSTENAGDFANNTPLRLADAAQLAFPGGGMTVSGLRRERDRGRLVTEMIAGKEFTTLAEIERMRIACRVQKPLFFPLSPTAAVASTTPPAEASEVVAGCTPRDALKAKLQALMKPSPPTSARPTGRRSGSTR